MLEIKGKKVLVAGGGGFLGSHVCQGLIKEGAEVAVLDVAPGEKLHRLARLEPRPVIITGSVTDGKTVTDAVEGMDAVVDASFPAAGCDRNPDNQHVAVGTVGVFNLLKAVLQHGSRFVFASSISVYGVQKYIPVDEGHPLEPVLLYGATKLAGEHYCRVMAKNYGCRAVALRFSDLYGPGDGRNGAPLNFLRKALRGEPLPVTGDGQQSRSYLFAADAARAVVQTLKNFRPGGVYNITGTEPMTILELAETVRRVTGARVPVEFMPGSAADCRNYIIDGSLAQREIGFVPQVSMAVGLSLTLRWLSGREGGS